MSLQRRATSSQPVGNRFRARAEGNATVEKLCGRTVAGDNSASYSGRPSTSYSGFSVHAEAPEWNPECASARRRHRNGHDVRLGEVEVIVGALLGAHGVVHAALVRPSAGCPG